MNYTNLVKAVKTYAENEFPDTLGAGGFTTAEQIAEFVRQAEKRIYTTVDLPVTKKTSSGLTLTTSDNTYDLPADWQAMVSVSVTNPSTNERVFLINKDESYIYSAYPIPSNTGLPKHYALIDYNTILVGPTPAANYAIELNYFYYPESIVTASTTWLGDNFETVLLYGTLVEAFTFMQAEEDVMKKYNDRYMEALAQLKRYAEGKNRQDLYRTEENRVPVK